MLKIHSGKEGSKLVATDVTIVANIVRPTPTTRTFLFRGVSMKPRKAQPAIAVPLVDTTPANTTLFRFFGQTTIAHRQF